MINKQILIQRLTYVKYLYKLGYQQSLQSEPYSSFAVLIFHDCIEMALHLMRENLGKRNKVNGLMSYFSMMPELTLGPSIERLNILRNKLKHNGILPSRVEIETSRVNTTDFLVQNTKVQFDLEFNDISLAKLVNNKASRFYLSVAERDLIEGKYDLAIKAIVIGYSYLVREYEASKKDLLFSSRLTYGLNISRDINPFWDKDISQHLRNFVTQVNQNMEIIQENLRILSLGIDPIKYQKFKLISPHVVIDANGEYHVSKPKKELLTKVNCQYCFDFVLECALKIQKIDFALEDLSDEILIMK